MGIDGEPVDVRLDGVRWSQVGERDLRGVVRLQHRDFPDDRWVINLHIPTSIAENRGVVDISTLGFGSRVFVIDPHGDELRAQVGDVVVNRRGAGRVDAIFGGQPDQPAIGISVDWNPWDVEDRRDISGGGTQTFGGPE